MKATRRIVLLCLVATMVLSLASTGTALATGSTSLCKENKTPCPEAQRYPAGTFVETSALFPKILGTFFGLTAAVECSSSTIVGITETKVGTPLPMSTFKWSFFACKSSFGGECSVVPEHLSRFLLLRTAANLGTLSSSLNQLRVDCNGFPEIHCTVGGLPQMHAEGSPFAEFTASNAVLTALSGSSCPAKPTLDALYRINSPFNVFISS